MSSQVPEVDDLLALEAELAEVGLQQLPALRRDGWPLTLARSSFNAALTGCLQLGDAPMDAFEDAQEAPKPSDEVSRHPDLCGAAAALRLPHSAP